MTTRPLSHTQRQIWTAQRLYPDRPLANMGKRHRIRGALDAALLIRAFHEVVRGTEILRSTIEHQRGAEAVRRVHAEPPRLTEIVELAVGDLEQWSQERIVTPLDATQCVYDSVILRHSDADWTWWLDLHHVVTDAWSSALVFRSTESAYQLLRDARSDEEDCFDATILALSPFDEYLVDLRQRVDPSKASERARQWSEDAEGFADRPPLAPYGPRGPRTTAVDRQLVGFGDFAARLRAGVDDDAYRALSTELGLLGLLISGLAATLHRLDGRAVLSFGVPIHHRSGGRAGDVIGPLMELYPLRVRLEPDDTFASLASRVRSGIIGLLRRARPEESPAQDFEVVVNVLHASYGDFDGLATTTEWMRSGHVEPDHAVRLQAYDFGDELQIELDLSHSLSADDAHHSLPSHLETVLRAALADPSTMVSDVELVSSPERSRLASLNPPRASDREAVHRPVHEVIRDLLRSEPTWIVADQAGREMDAGELDRRADACAAELFRRDVRAGDLVGLRMTRSLDLLVAVHGVLRAGAAFVMLDPAHPVAHNEMKANDAAVRVILDGVPDAGAGLVQPVSSARAIDPDATAYVLYTSGSTGTPKGVPISHRGLADYLEFALSSYVDVDAGDFVMPMHSGLVFDLTITSLFLPLLAGGRIAVVDQDGVEGLAQIAADDRLTVLKATPSQVDLLVRMLSDRTRLHTVIVGGEAFRRPTALALSEVCALGARIFNEYGPTEAVVGCMIHRWDPVQDTGADVPIGRACPGAEVFVLDQYGRRTAPGAWGELYVRRPGMATRYLNRPDLTAAGFVLVDGVAVEPLYRTGDRVRLERSDVLVYGGRVDDQLTVNGIRLEPGEVEAALVTHPDVDNAVVRVWERLAAPRRRCRRCGLGNDAPGIEFDGDDCCSICREFDEIAPQTRVWFRTPDDLDARRDAARAARTGSADCIHLLSGGKDSTYALYQLVERGWEVHALTLDNGFISPGAIANISRTVADLGISHEFVRTEAMNEIFRDSLERFANVCNGCFKTLYTLAISRARELGIPVIVTGLSRGQFFETRLAPHQFELGRFDPLEVDATVLEARRAYHRTEDAVTRLVPEQEVFDDAGALDQIEFVDFYRFVDVALDEMYEFLDTRAPWVRPTDTGRSTNCMINDVGIWVHRRERGYHNYAEPYAWDVRLGHKTREGSLHELDDDLDEPAVREMLSTIGYEPKISTVLTAWYRTSRGHDIDPDALRRHLRDRLPEDAIPAAFVRIEEIPLAASAKVDVAALPAPTRFRRRSADGGSPVTRVECELAAIWGELLGVEHVGVEDDFFDLGGASLAALEAVAVIEEKLGVQLDDAAVFHHRTIGELAIEIGTLLGSAPMTGPGVLTARSRPRAGQITRRRDTPLSAGQRGLLYEFRTEPTTSRYGVTRRYRFRTGVDPARLKSALTAVIERHDTLRTSFSEPRRDLTADEALRWAVHDGSADDIDRIAARLAAEPFDIDNGPLLRATFVDRDMPELILSLHHLWCDAGSLDILWRDIGTAYRDGSLPALPLRYSDHAAWQAEGVTTDDEEFWNDLLAGIDSSPQLDLVWPSPPEPDGYLRRPVPLAEVAGKSSSIFPAFVAAVDVVLGAMSDDPVLVGIPVTLRDIVDAHEVVGYFLNTIALPLPPTSDTSFAELCEETKSLLASAIPHRTVPYSSVVAARRRSRRSGELARVMVVHDPRPESTFAGLDAESETIFNGTAVTDLSLLVTETDEGCVIAAEWSGQRFRSVDVTRVVERLADVMAAGIASPERAADDLVERATDCPGPALRSGDGTVLDRFDRQVHRLPTAAAVRQGHDSLTYSELEANAEIVARELLRRGVTAGGRVALVLHPSVRQVAAIFGVLRVGAAYVPVDPAYPAERVERILRGSSPTVVLRDGDLSDLLAHSPDPTPGPLPPVTPEHPAYVIYTSATTGVPKGIQALHRHLAASNGARLDHYERAPTRFLWASSFGFDSSMVGLFWTLTTGGEMIVPASGRNTDVDHLVDLIEDRSVTHVLTVPTIWSALLRRASPSGGPTTRLSSLTDVIVAGEAVTAATVDEHHQVTPDAMLWNEYGPTETTVWATVHRCLPGRDPVPIGRPIPGAVIRVADADGRPRPIGVAGELWIGGAGVTDGYIDDVGSTSRQFVTATESNGARWYRTGDRVMLPSSGELEFLGRRDGQLNVGGMRVEPEEIEEQLCRWEGIRDACVVAARDRPILVAHIAADDDVELPALLGWLGERLPASHIPRRVACHRELPRTPHGKLDRDAVHDLPDGTRSEPSTPVHAASGSATELVAEVWRQVLGTTNISSDTDYFDAGGDSLAAVEIVMSIAERTGDDVPIATLLAGRTPARMAALIGLEAQSANDTDRRVERVVLRHGEPGGGRVVIVSTPRWIRADRLLAESFPDETRVVALVLTTAAGGGQHVVELARECLYLTEIAGSDGKPRSVVVVGRGETSAVAHALVCMLDLLGGSPRGLLLVEPVAVGPNAGRAPPATPLQTDGTTGSTAARTWRRMARSTGRALIRWGRASATAIPSGTTDAPTILYCSPAADRPTIERSWRALSIDLRVVDVEESGAALGPRIAADSADLIDGS